MPKIVHAVRMQRFRTHKLAVDACKYGMTSERALQITFADLSVRLRDTSLIKTMKLILHRVCVLTAEGVRFHPCAEQTKNVNVRVFLAAYMIVHFPVNVFETINKLETTLISTASKMLAVFEVICGKIRMSKRGSSVEHLVKNALDFPLVLHEYLAAFQAWKLPDEAKLTDRIKHALNALYQAEDDIIAQGGDDQELLRVSIRASQERIRAKLVQIAGTKVLEKLDADRGKVYVKMDIDDTNTQPVVPSDSTDLRYSVLPKRMSNEQLNHELLLDPAFVLYPNGGSPGENPVFEKIRETFANAFWASLQDDLCLDPPCYERITRVFNDIKAVIKELSEGGCGAQNTSKIDEIIDADLILQTAQNGAFSWEMCVTLVESVMYVLHKFQKDSRFDMVCDKEGTTTRTWQEVKEEMNTATLDPQKHSGVFCRSLRFLLDYTKAVRMQLANYRMSIISPTIALRGVEYESAKFDAKLTAGTVSLTETRSWLRGNIRTLVETQKIALEDLTTRDSAKNASYVFTLQSSILGLITDPKPIRVASSPELLLLDVTRMNKMQSTFQLIVLAGSILAIVAQRLSHLRLPNIKMLLDTLASKIMAFPQTSAGTEPITKMVRDEIETSCEISEDELRTLHEILKKGVVPTKVIPTIITTRLVYTLSKAVLIDAVDFFSSDSVTDDTFATFSIPMNMRPLVPYFRKHIQSIRSMMALNSKVHNIRYNDIIASESNGFICSLESFKPGDSVAVGFKMMTVREAGNRLKELIKSGSIGSTGPVCVRGGFIVRDGLDWTVVETNEAVQYNKALLMPIQIDLVKLAPGALPSEGFRFVTTAEAGSVRWKDVLVGGWLQQWSIAKLGDGKIDGIGYGGKVTQGFFQDDLEIGEALVTSV